MQEQTKALLARFEAALQTVESQNRTMPSIWEEHALRLALDAFGTHQAGNVERALGDLRRAPTAHDLAALDWSRPRQSIAEIRAAFEALKQRR